MGATFSIDSLKQADWSRFKTDAIDWLEGKKCPDVVRKRNAEIFSEKTKKTWNQVAFSLMFARSDQT